MHEINNKKIKAFISKLNQQDIQCVGVEPLTKQIYHKFKLPGTQNVDYNSTLEIFIIECLNDRIAELRH